MIDAYGMGGAGGQSTIIVPSRDLVIVRLGHYKGAPVWRDAQPRSLELIMEAVPLK
jgi:CubicO group peptidase (beta-lactamase class C family)